MRGPELDEIEDWFHALAQSYLPHSPFSQFKKQKKNYKNLQILWKTKKKLPLVYINVKGKKNKKAFYFWIVCQIAIYCEPYQLIKNL